MKGHAMMGFNHEVLGLAENPARGNGLFHQNTSGYALQKPFNYLYVHATWLYVHSSLENWSVP